MSRARPTTLAAALALALSVGCDGPEPIPPDTDTDGDCIPDIVEGRSESDPWVDTDGDGRFDHVDRDSDDDGIEDRVEALNPECDLEAIPADSDGDGTPNYRDLDSDDNELPDADEGAGDDDGDGLPDFADDDDDGDGLLDVEELGPEPTEPLDSDGDGEADFRDLDSDDDTILDADEGRADSDDDGVPDRIDEDSDDDGVADVDEAGDDDLETPPVDTDDDGAEDFRDADSDGDYLDDGWEEEHLVDLGTDRLDPDTDDDGATDWLEVALETDPDDEEDNPAARGILVVEAPFGADPAPAVVDLAATTTYEKLDVHLLIDLTRSMEMELGTVRTQLLTIIDSVRCETGEDPATTGCVPDVWVGFAWFTEADTEVDGDGFSSYTNVMNVTDDLVAVQDAIPRGPETGEREAQLKAVYCAAHGPGGHCPADAQSLDEQPCPEGRLGYPCFRPDAQRTIVLITDEDLRQDPEPAMAIVADELLAAQIAFIGINAEATRADAVTEDLAQLATLTGSLDEAGEPLVFFGSDGDVDDAVSEALGAAARVPRDVTVLVEDDPTDELDATALVDHVEVAASPGPTCVAWADVADSDGDLLDDTYLAVPPMTTVCWDLHLRRNDLVEAVDEPALVGATVRAFRPPTGPVLRSWPLYFFVVP